MRHYYHPHSEMFTRRIRRAALNPERRQAILNQWAIAISGHVLPWCDRNNWAMPDPLSTAARNLRGMIRGCRHLPTIDVSEADLRNATDATGGVRRSARNNVAKAVRRAFGLPVPSHLDADALRAILRRTGARDDVRQWSRNMDLRTAWMTCERGDWLLWLAARLGVDRKQVVLAACQCARLALAHVPAGEERPRQAIETAEAWCRGEATIEHVGAAAVAAYDAAYVDAYDAAAQAAHAALVAAQAAFADYVAAVARAAARADARADTLRQCADLVRQAIPYRTIAAAARRMLKESR